MLFSTKLSNSRMLCTVLYNDSSSEEIHRDDSCLHWILAILRSFNLKFDLNIVVSYCFSLMFVCLMKIMKKAEKVDASQRKHIVFDD